MRKKNILFLKKFILPAQEIATVTNENIVLYFIFLLFKRFLYLFPPRFSLHMRIENFPLQSNSFRLCYTHYNLLDVLFFVSNILPKCWISIFTCKKGNNFTFFTGKSSIFENIMRMTFSSTFFLQSSIVSKVEKLNFSINFLETMKILFKLNSIRRITNALPHRYLNDFVKFRQHIVNFHIHGKYSHLILLNRRILVSWNFSSCFHWPAWIILFLLFCVLFCHWQS